MAKDKVVVYDTTGTRVEFSLDGATWQLIPGAMEWGSGGGDAPVTPSSNFLQSQQSVGRITPPTITIPIDPLVSIHPAFKRLATERAAGRAVWFRYTTPQEELLAVAAARLAAVAITTGAVTFSGTESEDTQKERWTQDDFSLGLALRIGNALYPVDTISDDGDLVVVTADGEAPTQAVAATQYSIVRPSERQTMRGRIVGSTNTNKTLSADSHATGTLTIAPSTVPDEAVPVYTV